MRSRARYRATTFTLIFASPGLVRSFNSGRHPQVVAGALYEALGLRLQVRQLATAKQQRLLSPAQPPIRLVQLVPLM